ncbi:nucleotidyltransferase domain-containing protein [Pseudomonas aeruginosa]|uniref:nucleotidyltransferase domain-containing protein n=1 Tax=Pseudomonas aeruginosa TaxID=287 RepID=UPI0016544470|nr:nucleotidyltransferase domain-containing protein [Pseudomonas aeruginosa]EMB2825419.1 nucleotidyltransferase domain-containing protein [Pseudomonas aeruginosa]
MDTEALLDRWAERLRREEPRAVAVLCHGSYARGAAEAHSDLDLDVLVAGEHEGGYRSAFEELPDGRLLHATIATASLDDWLEEAEGPGESEEWAFFLPARQVARLLWAAPAARARLEGRITLTLAAAPQLQDLLESAAKVRNAAARGDEPGVRLAAQDMALRCPALLAPPDHPAVDTRRAALQAALDMPGAPPGYREDLLACLGLSGAATTAEEIHDRALRLARGVVGALAARRDGALDLLEPGLPEALADGRALRLLTQD